MIRPLTVATFLLACSSGLYLYQSKHEVQVLDRTIERTVHETNALREQSRLLVAEWTMLTNPDRLRQFSDTYLSLKTITPSQFSSLADLDNRLPAPRVEAPAAEEETVPIVVAPDSTTDTEPEPVATAQDVLPVPPVPATRSAQVATPLPRPPDAKTPESKTPESKTVDSKLALARPVTASTPPHAPAEARAAEPHSAEPRAGQRVAEIHAPAREPSALAMRPVALAAPRPLQANTPVYTASVASSGPSRVASATNPVRAVQVAGTQTEPFAGSLLGMAHGTMPPAPRPTPVNASYNAN